MRLISSASGLKMPPTAQAPCSEIIVQITLFLLGLDRRQDVHEVRHQLEEVGDADDGDYGLHVGAVLGGDLYSYLRVHESSLSLECERVKKSSPCHCPTESNPTITWPTKP